MKNVQIILSTPLAALSENQQNRDQNGMNERASDRANVQTDCTLCKRLRTQTNAFLVWLLCSCNHFSHACRVSNTDRLFEEHCFFSLFLLLFVFNFYFSIKYCLYNRGAFFLSILLFFVYMHFFRINNGNTEWISLKTNKVATALYKCVVKCEYANIERTFLWMKRARMGKCSRFIPFFERNKLFICNWVFCERYASVVPVLDDEKKIYIWFSSKA